MTSRSFVLPPTLTLVTLCSGDPQGTVGQLFNHCPLVGSEHREASASTPSLFSLLLQEFSIWLFSLPRYHQHTWVLGTGSLTLGFINFPSPHFSSLFFLCLSPHRVIRCVGFVLSDLGTWVTYKLRTFICLIVLEAGRSQSMGYTGGGSFCVEVPRLPWS